MTPESLMQQLDETYFVQKLELLVKQAYEHFKSLYVQIKSESKI